MSLEQFLHLSTPSISDAMDLLGLSGAPPEIHLVTEGAQDLILGHAYTVRFQSVTAGTFAPAADFIDEVPSDSVIVLANDGRRDCTVWGGILTHCAKRLGLRGTVIDGICRDLEVFRRLAYPVYALGVGVQSGKNRARMVETQAVVEIASISVTPGDIVCADGNGILILPQSRAAEILELANVVHESENRILDFYESGGTLSEARRKFNYNRLALPTD